MKKKTGLAALVLGAALALSPAALMAEDHDGHRGDRDRQEFRERARHEEHEEHERAERFRRGWGGPSVYFGFGYQTAPQYPYAYPYNSYPDQYQNGYYDQYGNWIPYNYNPYPYNAYPNW